jgi:hypothetical protein
MIVHLVKFCLLIIFVQVQFHLSVAFLIFQLFKYCVILQKVDASNVKILQC